jgi:hypothetical protein
MPKPITALLIGVALSAGCTINAGTQIDELAKLRQQAKFQPTPCYTGVDVPEDLASLTSAVNSAIADIANQPQPRDPLHVKRRLEQLMQEVDLFATEDREEAYRYVIRIWRAAGMKSESGLFPKSDADVLRQMPGC